MTIILDPFANVLRTVKLAITSSVARPPALRNTADIRLGPKKFSGTTRGSRQVTTPVSKFVKGHVKVCLLKPNARISSPPGLAFAPWRICVICGGVLYVSTNLELFSSSPAMRGSMSAIIVASQVF